MDKYKDIFESVLAELVETPKDERFLANAKIRWGKSDEWNKNKRFYSDLVATPAITAFNNESQKGVGIVGQLDHPMGTGNTLLSNASHLITKVWKDDQKVWWAETKIMNTSRGKDLLAVLKTGTKIGASLRGIGEVDKDGKVKAGLKISAIDFVSSPSFGASATVDQSSVFESFVPEEKYEFNEDDLTAVTNALDELSDKVVGMVQEKLKKSDHIEMTKGQIKVLPIWIKCSKDNPNIAPFHEWFKEMCGKFAKDNPQDQYAINEEQYRQSILKNEERIAGSFDNANTMFESRKRIEARQKEIDEALVGSRHDAKTISRLFAEYVLAGGKLSRVEYIKEFGF